MEKVYGPSDTPKISKFKKQLTKESNRWRYGVT